MNRIELQRYFTSDLGWGWNYQGQLVFQLLIDAAQHAQGGVLLDAGAGHQRYRAFFDECLYLAQEHPIAGQNNKGIEQFDILCDVQTIPLQDNCLHGVLSTSSLEHMEFPQEFFQESFRALVPGGGLFINVPFMYGEHEQPYDFQRLTSFGLRRWYEAAGFERVEILPTSNSIFTATFWLGVALNEELINRYNNTSRFSVRRVFSFVERRSLRTFCAIIMKRWGESPHSGTTAPIGWVARGFKSGILPTSNKNYTAIEFLSKYGSKKFD